MNKLTSPLILTACVLLSLSRPVISSNINEVELIKPVNLYFVEAALNIGPYFSSDFNADIGDVSGNIISKKSSHVSINGAGDDSFDYYFFTITSGGIAGIFDIDYGQGSADSAGSFGTEIALC